MLFNNITRKEEKLSNLENQSDQQLQIENVNLSTTPTTTSQLNEKNQGLLDDPSRFPSGWNTKGILTVLGSFIGLIGSLGFVNSGGVISTYLSQNILVNESQSNINWIFSLYNFFAFGGSILSGPIFDSIGCKIPIFVGSIIMFLGLIATSFCNKLWQFILAYGILTGIGASLSFAPFVAATGHHYLTKRSIAIGLGYTGGGLGGVIFPLIFRKLFPKIGFGWTIRIGGFICLFFLVVGWLLVSDRHEEFHQPQDENIFKQIIHSIDFKILFKNLIFLVVVTGLLFNGLAFLITIVELPTYATIQGFGESKSSLLIVVFNAFSIPGRVIPSYFADHGLGRFNTFCIINVFSLVVFCIIWVPFGHHLQALFVFAGCFGFSSGSVLSLSASLVTSIVQTKDTGKSLGTAFFILSIADLFGLPIAGAITNKTPKSFDNLVYFLTVCAFVGACVSFISRYLYGGFNLRRI
ncbi:hypothetical protein KGF54_001724 [Candida jiufengensis]|uniref:uncharacterized protein n=1 Tax=Candida jiufengensis TaxID=497108 RepID=UPI002224D2D8|nr:uncharacterized protein KGF54_001724 [Candida jiufengensis]KAI5955163.1 hypothetical protein KGF54_001724 [Candida jiufengensis]